MWNIFPTHQIKAEEDRKYEKEKELKELIEEMQDEADTMSAAYISFKMLRKGVMSIADLFKVSTPSLTAIYLTLCSGKKTSRYNPQSR